MAGLPYEDVTYLVAGINHMAFFLKFEYQGQDAYPLLFASVGTCPLLFSRVRGARSSRLGGLCEPGELRIELRVVEAPERVRPDRARARARQEQREHTGQRRCASGRPKSPHPDAT